MTRRRATDEGAPLLGGGAAAGGGDAARLMAELDAAEAIADRDERQARLYFLAASLATCEGDQAAQARARAVLMALFDEGVHVAAVDAARLLLTGRGGEVDPNRGIAMLATAADAGSHVAALTLGKLYLALAGRAKEGIALLERAAESEPEAQHVLGIAYFNGIGVAADAYKARAHFAGAAEREFAPAQFELSLMWLWGHGGPEDAAESRRWEERAAAAGEPRACLNMGARAATMWNPAETNLDEAIRWYTRAAESGSEEAAERLADLYQRVAAAGDE